MMSSTPFWQSSVRGLLTVAFAAFGLSACVLSHGGGEGASPPKSPEQALAEAVDLFGGEETAKPAQVLADFDRAEDTANARELRHIQHLRPLVEHLMDKEPSLSLSDYQTIASTMAELSKDYPESFPLQLKLAVGLDFVEGALNTSVSPAGQRDADRGLKGATTARAQDLVRRFPTQSLAHAHLARVLATAGGEPLSVLRAWARCLQLDPNSAQCRERFKAAAADYTRPRCIAFDRSKFAVHRAHLAGRKNEGHGQGNASVKVKVGALSLSMEREPRLTGADIQEVTGASDGSGSAVITLTPSGAARFGALTSELAASQGYLIMEVAGKRVTAPQVMSPIDSGEIHIPAAYLPLAKICKTFETPKLPADLAGIR